MMPVTDPVSWSEQLRQNLHLYEEALLRQVAGRFIKPRNHWPVDDLIKRMVEAADNAVVIDRRLREMSPAGRQLLALVGHSRQPRWYVGHLIELLAALGHADPLAEVLALLQGGLLYPDFPAENQDLKVGGNHRPPARCKSFEDWLRLTPAPRLRVWAYPSITRRASGEELPLPDLTPPAAGASLPAGPVREADGLEWPLRLAILWQQVRAAPLRRTQQGDYFKRDLDRLRADPLLNSQPADSLQNIPDIGLLTASLAQRAALLALEDGQLEAADFPASWQHGLPETLAGLWLAGLDVDDWNGETGWSLEQSGNPYPSAYLLCLLLLRRLPEDRWCSVAQIVRWVLEHHPFWNYQNKPAAKKQYEKAAQGLRVFLLGVAYSLRLIQAAHDKEGEWLVRLSAIGRWLLGQGKPLPAPGFPQTLLVQPNLEILVYRQGLYPELLVRLTHFSRWKNLGAACSLHLEPDTVYAALEAGESFETILQTLQRHGIKPPPAPVIDALRTWSQKRERITVYPAALILEFLNPDDLEDALARSVPATRAGAQLAIIPREADIDYRHFRLISNRDYTLPPERCVSVAEDGVTLRVDLNSSDLLLESELRRFAEEVETAASVRVFRLTPASAQRARELGLTLESVQAWFQGRCDQPFPPAARLLFAGKDLPPAAARRLTIVQVANTEIADGLVQWPSTRSLVQQRIGPTALVVSEEALPVLRERLAELGMALEE